MTQPVYPDGSASKGFIISPKLEGTYYVVMCPKKDGSGIIAHFWNSIEEATEHLKACNNFCGDDSCFIQKASFDDISFA